MGARQPGPTTASESVAEIFVHSGTGQAGPFEYVRNGNIVNHDFRS